MNSTSQAVGGSLDIANLSSVDKDELRQFLANEGQKTQIQQSVHGLAETCWKKCVTGTIRGGKLDKSEESCAANCVDRFLDTSVTVIKQLEAMRQQ